MVDIAKLDELLKGSRAVETPKHKLPPPPVATYLTDDIWPECFDIDRFPAPPPIEVQPIIGPPAFQITIRDAPGKPSRTVLSHKLPDHADATEYHRIDNRWYPIEPAWMDASNWVGGYWRPWR